MSQPYAPPQRRTLAAGEVGAALAALDLRASAASPLAGAVGHPATRVDLDEAATRALRVLAAPTASLRQRHAGPWLPFGLASACLQAGTAGIAVALPQADAGLELLWYADVRSFVDDWLDSYASSADDEGPNLLPPPLPLTGLPLVLHAIDAFRRASYRSALDYASDAPLALPVAEFHASLRAAAASADLRWLLPAFLQLTPGLDLAALVPGEADLGLLADCELLGVAGDGPTQTLAFGTAGHLLGSEFLLGWQRAVGLELVRHHAHGEEMLARLFIAPTHLANHCFELAADGSVNHQPLRVSVLAQRLDEWLERAAQAPEAAAHHCPRCGEPVGARARFCAACGQPLGAP